MFAKISNYDRMVRQFTATVAIKIVINLKKRPQRERSSHPLFEGEVILAKIPNSELEAMFEVQNIDEKEHEITYSFTGTIG